MFETDSCTCTSLHHDVNQVVPLPEGADTTIRNVNRWNGSSDDSQFSTVLLSATQPGDDGRTLDIEAATFCHSTRVSSFSGGSNHVVVKLVQSRVPCLFYLPQWLQSQKKKFQEAALYVVVGMHVVCTGMTGGRRPGTARTEP
jgi:hypothetical protein